MRTGTIALSHLISFTGCPTQLQASYTLSPQAHPPTLLEYYLYRRHHRRSIMLCHAPRHFLYAYSSSPHFVYFSRCLSTCQYDDLSKLYKSFLGIFLVPDVIDFYLLLDAGQCVGRSKYKPNTISFCGYSNFLLYNLDKSS